MKFLIDACLPRAVSDAIVALGHVCVDVRDVGLADVDDAVVAAYSRRGGCCLLTEDWGFADIRSYPPGDYSGIVVFDTHGMSRADKVDVVREFVEQSDILTKLHGRLAVVSGGRIRMRPPI